MLIVAKALAVMLVPSMFDASSRTVAVLGTMRRQAVRGFRIQDSGFRIQDSGFRIQDSGFRIQDSGDAAPLAGKPWEIGLLVGVVQLLLMYDECTLRCLTCCMAQSANSALSS
ncbi:hypothetical protein EIP73_04340 [Xylella fastidiosa subsp. pauca]|nr:hypothetical protein EIP73_04340 [Xylella fastidiosa subsp. pauca]